MNNKVKTHQTMEERLNAIRAGVLGSNDGILTVVGVLFSVGAATSNVHCRWLLVNMHQCHHKRMLKRWLSIVKRNVCA